MRSQTHDEVGAAAPAHDWPVAIVGAGPVGMMLALQLARRGVRSLIVEHARESRQYPKGNTHNARTMEHYRSIGLADRVRQTGLPADHPTDVAYFSRLDEFELQRIPMPSTNQVRASVAAAKPTDQVPEPVHRSNQMYVEKLLLERVQNTPEITCLLATDMVDFTASDGGVRVTLLDRDLDDVREVYAGYLVGCDGPRSEVRRRLGVRYVGEDAREPGFMNGLQHSSYVRVPGLDNRLRDRRCWQYWVLRPGILSNLVSLDGHDEFVYHTVQAEVVDEDTLRRQIRDCVGADLEVQILGTQEWIAGRALVAERYGQGRVLLCGDSIHLFSPTGGFGMNTGVDDAVNLAWKLAGTVQGWGGPGLIASFEAERRPIAVRNTRAGLNLSKNLQSISLDLPLSDLGPDGDRARTRMGELLRGFDGEFASLGVQLGARYDGSPIVYPEGSEPPADSSEVYEASACPGGRAPHVWMDATTSLYDRFGTGFTLLRLTEGGDADGIAGEAGRRAIPLDVVEVEVDDAADLYQAPLALVRPDGHVAWRGGDVRLNELWDVVTGSTA